VSKQASGVIREGILTRPYEAFYGCPLSIGTVCEIMADHEDTYRVKFPNQVGYSGTFSIKKVYVKDN